MSSNIMIYGAGAIGRGFLAPIFNKLGYKISFVDKDVHLIKELEKRRCYTTAKTKEDKYDFQEVCVESSYLLGEESSALKKTDFVFTCVGPRNSSSLANRIKNVPCIISFENERDSVNILKGVPR
ncbi:MAG: hypothetical protein IMF19_12755 [Proteobacteria bacterium]|nr:hypothetical protein [Pseudomonadota bacterium]